MKRKVLMWIIVAIVARCIVGCNNSTQNTNDATMSKFEEFRLKWAGNNGKEWNKMDMEGETLCFLISKNHYDKDTAAVFAKIFVGIFEPKPQMLLFISNINCETVKNVVISMDNKNFPTDVQSKYLDLSSLPPTSGMKMVVGEAVDKCTGINIDPELIGELKKAHIITVEIPINGEKFKFEFETANTIE